MCNKPCICRVLRKDQIFLEKKFLEIWFELFSLTEEAQLEVEAKNDI